jgi:hypothetical protein
MQKTLSFRGANQRARAKRGPMINSVSEPGIQPPALILFLDSGSVAISAFTRVFDALWRRPGMIERVW